MIFDHSWAFWLYIPLGLLAIVLWRTYRWRARTVAQLGAVRGVKPVSVRGSIFLLFGLASLIFATTGPRWGKGSELGVTL